MEWLDQHSADISALSAASSAVFALILLGVTAWYASLTKKIAKASRDSQRAFVFLDFAPGRVGLELCVTNDGTRPASDIKVSVRDASREVVKDALAELTPIKTGLHYLAPSRVYRYSLRLADHQIFGDGDGQENRVEFLIRYRDEDKTRSETTVIDLRDMVGVSLSSFADPTERVATAIDGLGRTLKPLRGLTQMRDQFMPKCRFCAEPIRSGAKKCAKCGEWQAPRRPRPRRRSLP